MNQKYEKAAFADIFKYSFGGLGSNLAYLLVMSFLTFFYTDVFGISSMAVASLMLVARLIDAVTDPVMGMIGDNTKSKMGRFRPWIMFGAPVLGILIFLMFTAPDLSPNMKIVYAYIIYIAYSLASTVVNIPYHALTPVLSKDPQQRTVIVAWKQGMGVLSQFVVTILALPMVNAFGGGSTGWAVYGAVIGSMTTISFWVCAWGGKKYDKCNMDRPKEKFKIKDNIKLITRNRPLLLLMTAYGTDVLANAACNAVNMYYLKYVLHREELMTVFATVMLLGGVLSLPIMPVLSRMLGKKRLYWLGSFFSIVPLAIMWFRPTAPVVMLMSLFGVFGFVSKFPSNLGWAMLPECVDFAEWKYGKRGDGLISASLTFINKLGMAIGGTAASFCLGLAGFVANQPQGPAVIKAIVFIRFGLPILGFAASLIAMHFYEITSEKYDVIRRELDERKNLEG